MKKLIIIFLIFVYQNTFAQYSATVQNYINTYKDIAILEMKRTGIPAAITIAQGILETESGTGELVLKSNNHFGIKCKSNWTGETAYHNDDEKGECFRKYSTAMESYKDHSDFLKASERYAFLFEYDVKDFKAWAHGLKKAGYATNPRYPYILINSIEKYNLNQYTLLGLEDATFGAGKTGGPDNGQIISVTTDKMENQSGTPMDQGLATVKRYGINAVYANEGTSLLSIATRQNIPLNKLMAYNDLQHDGLLLKDQWIYLDKKLKQGAGTHYIVKLGQSLHDVAQENAIQLEMLSYYNPQLSGMQLAPGSTVYLQAGLVKSDEKNIVPLAQKILHYVSPKESLYAISKKYNVSVQQIEEWNNLANENLHVGQQLVIIK
ncbi:MAG: glucosaminidase domain-containing protein [Ferruginibacter sp.]